MLNGLSVDVEDAFHASAFEKEMPPEKWSQCEQRAPGNTDRLLELFEARGVRGTFFILGWIAEHHPELVKRIHAAGHEIACHGYAHRLIYNQTPEVFREDVRRAKSLLEDLTGTDVAGYRAPSYSITPKSAWALDVLADLGFRYDSSIFPVRGHDRYGFQGMPRFPYRVRARGGAELTEVPPSSLWLGFFNLPVAGGGYLRLYPLTMTRLAIELFNRVEQGPAFVYVHPWEIDPDQPRLTTEAKRWWRHTVNQKHTLGRLEALIGAYKFAPFREVIAAQVDWPLVAVPA